MLLASEASQIRNIECCKKIVVKPSNYSHEFRVSIQICGLIVEKKANKFFIRVFIMKFFLHNL